ncbi:excalibur calcium-binding domain-containing protein [Bisgaard Taxon 45]
MKRIGIALIIVMTACSVNAKRISCKHFLTQAEAQAYMEKYGAHHLDRDRDGEACECLPGGSQYGASRCRRR